MSTFGTRYPEIEVGLASAERLTNAKFADLSKLVRKRSLETSVNR